MAIVLGTNCGFVTVSPTDDPEAAGNAISNTSKAVKGTVPAGMTKITEVGWWCANASQEINFEVGLYSHDAGNDKPDNRLYVDATNAKGTVGGWKKVTVDWDVTPETIYWIAVQVDWTTPTVTKTDSANTDGARYSHVNVQTTLLNPWPASTDENWGFAIYALVEEGVTYSELSGTIAGVGTPSGNLSLYLINELSGTIAGVGAMSGNLGSVAVHIVDSVNYTRLVAVGNDQFYYEDI